MAMRRYSRNTIRRHEESRLFLMKFNAMHEVCGMPWDDCAEVYRQETGREITESALRQRVKRAMSDKGFVRVSEFPEKVVVSVYELSFLGCAWCAIRKLASRIAGWLGFRKGEQAGD